MESIALNDFAALWKRLGPRVLEAVERVGESGQWILGSEVRAFEADLAAIWQLPHAVGCASGLDAIEIALRCAGLRPGERVLTTPLSAFATSLAVVRAGGIPVFADVDASGQLDLALCESLLAADADLRFLLPVHLYGHALDLVKLSALRERFDLVVVEDCAQAFAARSRGTPAGSVGQVAATSFYPTKNLGAMGDGGALLTRSPEIAERARSLRDYGQRAKYEHTELGMNSRLDELQAAILRRALLPEMDAFTRRRRAIAARYAAGISHPAVRPLPTPEGSESVWHLFPVLVEGEREQLREHLRRGGVASGLHYPQLIPDQPALAGRAEECTLTPLAQARRIADSEVSLPIHPQLSDEDVDRVIDACNTWRN